MVGSENVRLKPYRPLADETDRSDLLRASVVIALADGFERRLGARPLPEPVWTLQPGRVELATSISAAWRPRALAARFKRAFGLRLAISHGAESA